MTAGYEPVPQPQVPYGPVATFKTRRGRLTDGQTDALARLFPVWGVRVEGQPLDLAELFGREAPRVLDVGSGMGEATLAAARPDVDVLAVEVHTPGIATLLRDAEAAGLRNVRVADGDVRILLTDMLASDVLSEVRVWFPDPWPKLRHHKRRLVTADFLELVASRLRPGGMLSFATDWEAYAEQVLGLLDASPLRLVSRERPETRPVTRFEQQGLDAGRVVSDLVAVRP